MVLGILQLLQFGEETKLCGRQRTGAFVDPLLFTEQKLEALCAPAVAIDTIKNDVALAHPEHEVDLAPPHLL